MKTDDIIIMVGAIALIAILWTLFWMHTSYKKDEEEDIYTKYPTFISRAALFFNMSEQQIINELRNIIDKEKDNE